MSQCVAMTETLSRPADPAPPEPTAGVSREVLRTGGSLALWTVVVGLLLVGVPVLLTWAVESRSGTAASDMVRSAGQLWLLAHGVSLEVPDGRVGLTPLGLCALPLVLLVRAGSRMAEQCRPRAPRPALWAAFAVAVPYALLAGLVAAFCSTGAVRPSPAQAVLAGLGMGMAGAGAGAVRRERLGGTLWRGLPARARRRLVAAAGAGGRLIAAGSLLAGAALAVHLPRAAELAAASEPGPVGGVVLLLLGLTLVPNAVVWAVSWLSGTGFAVGAGTSVDPSGSSVGPVPAFPLLAALPEGASPGWLAAVALLVPVAAGALAGRRVLRGLGRSPSLLRTVAEAAAVGPACGLVWAALAWLSGGPLGGDRLSVLGPAPVQLGLAVTGLVAAGAVGGALLQRRRERDREQAGPEQEPAGVRS